MRTGIICYFNTVDSIRKAEHAENKKDFIYKLSMVLKEANETGYRIELLTESVKLEWEKPLKYYRLGKNFRSGSLKQVK